MSRQELVAAIESGDADAAARVLEACPALAAEKTEQGISWVLHALYHRQAEIAELIAARRGDELDLHEVVALGRPEPAERLLAAAPEAIDRRSPDGFTPLHYAAFFGRPRLAALLIERGAEVNAVADNPTRVCPLHSATACGDVAICKQLLAAGANPDARQQAGFTALMAAALHGKRELVDLLLDFGAGTNLTSDDRRTAADFAREGGYDELAELLAGGGGRAAESPAR